MKRREGCFFMVLLLLAIRMLWYFSSLSSPPPLPNEKDKSTSHPTSPPTSLLQSNAVTYQVATELPKHVTIVVQLSGEMANNLHHIAHGLGLQYWVKDVYGIDSNLVLRHQEGPNNRAPNPKWKSARDNLQQCFPSLALLNFAEGNNKQYTHLDQLQQLWLLGKGDRLTGLVNSADEKEIQTGLELLATNILIDPQRPWVDDTSTIRLPFIRSESLDVFPMIDRYFSKISDVFVFNETACCALVPDANDSVFHFRNYQSEMPSLRAYQMGFAELSPEQTSTELFAHLESANDRVQITTRIPNQAARNYAEALKERGVEANLVTGQSAMQDFCFLRSSKRELAGSARSTFVLWAALLGNMNPARLYHVDNEGLRQRHPDYWKRFTYNFTHPALRDRIRFELYKAEGEKEGS
eukprot:Nitzschia sp. Nitz4//scaffold147_size54853//19180//20409//NITZ4_006614-RA/size54853-processed-gene-0.21-mRNA-1//-1//CDS//3329536684//7056//frame0